MKSYYAEYCPYGMTTNLSIYLVFNSEGDRWDFIQEANKHNWRAGSITRRVLESRIGKFVVIYDHVAELNVCINRKEARNKGYI